MGQRCKKPKASFDGKKNKQLMSMIVLPYMMKKWNCTKKLTRKREQRGTLITLTAVHNPEKHKEDQTLAFTTSLGNQRMQVLVDGGSTLSFLDINRTRQLGIEQEEIEPVNMALPNILSVLSFLFPLLKPVYREDKNT